MRCLFFCFASCFLSLTCQGQKTAPGFTKGVYGDPQALLDLGYTFKSLGINAIFVRSATLTKSLYRQARKEGVRVYVEFPTLNGKEYLAHHPEAWPLNEKGERASPADWFMGICPTDPGFKAFRVKELEAILETYQVDGIWLDYLHWHAQFESPQPILPETCFCDNCINKFMEQSKIPVPDGPVEERAEWILTSADASWREWRSEVVNGWVSDLKTVLKKHAPEALLGIYYCPWYPSDFDSAQYRILGLDIPALAKIADVFSPMLYHHLMKRPSRWIPEYTHWLDTYALPDKGKIPAIWPIVQAEDKPGIVSAAEFENVLTSGARAPSTGVMMFSTYSLIKSRDKLEAMKKLYISK